MEIGTCTLHYANGRFKERLAELFISRCIMLISARAIILQPLAPSAQHETASQLRLAPFDARFNPRTSAVTPKHGLLRDSAKIWDSYKREGVKYFTA